LTNLKRLDIYTEYYDGFSKIHITACIIAAFLYFVLPDIVSYTIIYTPFLYNWYIGTSEMFRYVFSIVIQDAVVFIMLLTVFGRYILCSLKLYFSGGFLNVFNSIITIVLIYMTTEFLVALASPLVYFFSQNQNENQEAINTITTAIPALMVFVAVIVGPIVEEIIFRWGIFRPLYKINPVLAYVVSASLFAFAHVAHSVLSGNLYELANMIFYFIIGCALAFAYKHTQNFSAALLLHMLNNAISMALIITA